MNNSTTDTKTGPQFLIASYGVEGITAMNLLAHSEWLQADKERKDNVNFLQLEIHMKTARITEILSDIDMAFILGSDDDITAPPSALALALQCRENDIPCFTALIITALPGQMDIATGSLCNLSSNILQIPAKNPVDNMISCLLLKEAVMTVIGPLLGCWLVGVDMEDLKLMLRHGRIVHLGVGIAKGENRAAEAAQRAIQCLPAIPHVKSIFGNITCGSNFAMKEYSTISDILAEAPGGNFVYVLCTTLDVAMEEELRVGLICVTEE